jgi:hypothetical protein
MQALKHWAGEGFNFSSGLLPVRVLRELLFEVGMQGWFGLMHGSLVVSETSPLGQDGKEICRGRHIISKGLVSQGCGLEEGITMAEIMQKSAKNCELLLVAPTGCRLLVKPFASEPTGKN